MLQSLLKNSDSSSIYQHLTLKSVSILLDLISATSINVCKNDYNFLYMSLDWIRNILSQYPNLDNIQIVNLKSVLEFIMTECTDLELKNEIR